MRHPRISWLFQQVQDWQKSGIVSAYQAEAIRSQYVSKSFISGRKSLAALIWSVLGGFALVLGIVLMIATTWPSMGYGTRLTIAVLPLMATWGALGVMVIQKRTSVLWRESVACLNLGAITLAMALIAQLYNSHLSMGIYLITVTLVSLPVLFVTRSLGWVIATGIMMNFALVDAESLVVRCLMMGMSMVMMATVPDYIFKAQSPLVKSILGWCVCFGFTASLIWMSEALHPTAFMVLPAVVWCTLIGVGVNSTLKTANRIPLLAISVSGLFLTLFIGSFQGVWDEWVRISVVETSAFIVVLGLLIGLQLSLFSMFKTHWFRWTLVMTPILSLLGMVSHKFLPEWVIPLLFLILLLGYSVAAVSYGVKHHQRWWINGGVAALVVVMLAKFLASDWPASMRAGGLLVGGTVLLGVGYRLNRWVNSQ